MLVAYNTMKFENAIVKKGGNKKGFLTSQNQQSKDSMAVVKEAWKKMFSNSQDVEDNICVLNAGMDFKEASATSLEMQLNENKRTNTEEICRLFCVPPQIFSESAEGAKNALISNCITPTLNTIEAALDADLLLENEKGTKYFAFDTRELTRGNIIQRYQAYEIGLRNGFLQLPDVREQEDLKPIDFPYIKLGLNDVFYNPQTKVIYTPNTNQTAIMGENTANVLPDEGNGDIIEERGNPYHAKDGKFTFGKVRMSKREYIRVSHQIATDFPNLSADDGLIPYENRNHFYIFSVVEFGTYNYHVKMAIKGNEELISDIRNYLKEQNNELE